MKKILLAFLALVFCTPITHGMITPAYFLVYPQQKTLLDSLIELVDSAYYLEPSTYAWIKQQDPRAIAQTVDTFQDQFRNSLIHKALWNKHFELAHVLLESCLKDAKVRIMTTPNSTGFTLAHLIFRSLYIAIADRESCHEMVSENQKIEIFNFCLFFTTHIKEHLALFPKPPCTAFDLISYFQKHLQGHDEGIDALIDAAITENAIMIDTKESPDDETNQLLAAPTTMESSGESKQSTTNPRRKKNKKKKETTVAVEPLVNHTNIPLPAPKKSYLDMAKTQPPQTLQAAQQATQHHNVQQKKTATSTEAPQSKTTPWYRQKDKDNAASKKSYNKKPHEINDEEWNKIVETGIVRITLQDPITDNLSQSNQNSSATNQKEHTFDRLEPKEASSRVEELTQEIAASLTGNCTELSKKYKKALSNLPQDKLNFLCLTALKQNNIEVAQTISNHIEIIANENIAALLAWATQNRNDQLFIQAENLFGQWYLASTAPKKQTDTWLEKALAIGLIKQTEQNDTSKLPNSRSKKKTPDATLTIQIQEQAPNLKQDIKQDAASLQNDINEAFSYITQQTHRLNAAFNAKVSEKPEPQHVVPPIQPMIQTQNFIASQDPAIIFHSFCNIINSKSPYYIAMTIENMLANPYQKPTLKAFFSLLMTHVNDDDNAFEKKLVEIIQHIKPKALINWLDSDHDALQIFLALMVNKLLPLSYFNQASLTRLTECIDQYVPSENPFADLFTLLFLTIDKKVWLTVAYFSKESEYEATHAQEMARWPKFKETYSLPDDFCVL